MWPFKKKEDFFEDRKNELQNAWYSMWKAIDEGESAEKAMKIYTDALYKNINFRNYRKL